MLLQMVLFICFLWLSSILFGEGNGTPLQYSWLENPMDGGAWWATVHGVAKSQIQLSTAWHSTIDMYIDLGIQVARW